MRKRMLFLLAFAILASFLITPALAIVEQSEEFYVADYAGVLSESTKNMIISGNAELENNCSGAQIVVVAVEYLDGMYSDEYALEVMNEWGVGSAQYNNGMVLVFATEENKGWLMTGDGIDGYFTDDMADQYLNDYFWDNYDAGKYDEAVSKLFGKLVGWYANYYGVNNAFGYSKSIETALSNKSTNKSSSNSFSKSIKILYYKITHSWVTRVLGLFSIFIIAGFVIIASIAKSDDSDGAFGYRDFNSSYSSSSGSGSSSSSGSGYSGGSSSSGSGHGGGGFGGGGGGGRR